METAHRRRPGGPRGRLGIGNLYEYDRDRIGFLQRSQQEYGDVFRYSPSTSFVLEPGLTHEILAQTNRDFGAESFLFSGTRAALEEFTKVAWTGRRASRPGLNPKTVALLANSLLDRFRAVANSSNEKEVDVFDLMCQFTSGAAVNFCFGEQNAGTLAATLDRTATAIDAVTNSSLTYPRWLPIPRVRRAVKADQMLRNVLSAQVYEARQTGVSSDAAGLLQVLLSVADEPLKDDVIVEILHAVLRGARGTPAATLTWAVRELSLRPDIVSRIAAEARGLETLTSSGQFSSSSLPYTEAFVKELLRVYPPAWILEREVRHDTCLGEWEFTAGERIIVSPLIVHHDSRWWSSSPSTFSPERWLSGTMPHARHAFLPFGGGPRVCFGRQFAFLELTIAVAALAADYTIQITNLDTSPTAPQSLLLPRGLRSRIQCRASYA
ncbi:cytochrome P450 [Streptomyces sp. NPDC058251]|uniref:cytochrome P450 n=1 Tax=Streptomyces sp. NPDC058251 TaxID=3346404 RepID=UPI0036F15FAE